MPKFWILSKNQNSATVVLCNFVVIIYHQIWQNLKLYFAKLGPNMGEQTWQRQNSKIISTPKSKIGSRHQILKKIVETRSTSHCDQSWVRNGFCMQRKFAIGFAWRFTNLEPAKFPRYIRILILGTQFCSNLMILVLWKADDEIYQIPRVVARRAVVAGCCFEFRPFCAVIVIKNPQNQIIQFCKISLNTVINYYSILINLTKFKINNINMK